MYLFIDTTHNLSLGLLKESFSWLEFKKIETKKSSQLLHASVYDLLLKYDIELENLKAVIAVAGPGSYTGMRVSDGFTKVLAQEGMTNLSFYSYEVPRILGVGKGVFISKAFKGEFFVHQWGGGEEEEKRVVDIKNYKNKFDSIYSFDSELGNTEIINLIESKPEVLFKHIVENGVKRELLYYRSLEEEFKSHG